MIQPIKELSHWQHSKHGPKQFVVVTEGGDQINIDLVADFQWRDKLAGVIAKGIIQVGNSIGYTFAGPEGKIYGQADSVEQAIAEATYKLSQAVVAHEALVADPAAHLESEIAKFDWYAHYSDSFSVLQASDRHMSQTIKPLMEKVDPEVVKSIWNKYCPKGMEK